MDNVLSAVLVLGIMGGVFGAVLAVAARIFHVDQDEHITLVREALPGANCGGCGYPGCDGYAAAVAAGEAPPDKCVVGGLPVAAKVAEIMGIDAGAQEKNGGLRPLFGRGRGRKEVLRLYRASGLRGCYAFRKSGA